MGSRCQARIFPRTRFFSLQHSSFRDQVCIHTAVPLLGRAERSTKAQRIAPKARVVDGGTCRAIAVSLLRSRYVGNINSIRGGARLEWPSHRCHILIFGGNLDRDSQTMMQIYASAARLRSSGAHSCIRHESHWLWRATATSDRCLARRYSAVPRLMIFPVLSMFLCSQVDACSLKPSGTIPVFT